jgi:hypothetical protein
MPAVSEWIVREYFESLGYFVNQICKYDAPTRRNIPEEEIDLMVYNPAVREHQLPATILWDTSHLATVARAVVVVRGWHTERFYAGTFERIPEIVKFAGPDVMKTVAKHFGHQNVARILCIPNLPASSVLRERAVRMAKSKGIDGIIVFRTMLLELIEKIDTHANYTKSDLLQILRVMKIYDLIKTPQLDLFTSRRRRSASKISTETTPSDNAQKL